MPSPLAGSRPRPSASEPAPKSPLAFPGEADRRGRPRSAPSELPSRPYLEAALSPAETVYTPGDLRLPAEMVQKLVEPVQRLGLTLEATELSMGDGTIRFHRIVAAGAYVALLYVDEMRPDASNEPWYVSSLCVWFSRACVLERLEKPSLVFVAPRYMLLAPWSLEKEQCLKTGLVLDIQFSPVGTLADWEQSSDRAKRFLTEWTAALQTNSAQPKGFDEVDRLVATTPATPAADINPSPILTRTYHVFLASPNDLKEEREALRAWFNDFNKACEAAYHVRFEALDWERYSSAGVGQPEDLIIKQVLETYRQSLLLVVCMFGKRFGLPTANYGSGTEEEYYWALEAHRKEKWREVKVFFREPQDFNPFKATVEERQQLDKVLEFRNKIEPQNLCKTFSAQKFRENVQADLEDWLLKQAKTLASSRM